LKLVTFDEGRTGRLDGDVVVELDCGSTREYFERGGAVGETGARLGLADVRLRAPIVPKKFFHTAGNFTEHHEELAKVNWSHPVHKGIVFFQNVDAIIGPDEAVIYPEHLTKELDYELELAIIIGKSGKFSKPIAAEILPAGPFYPAEEYHQKYYQKNPEHYHSYAVGSGRYPFLERTWGIKK